MAQEPQDPTSARPKAQSFMKFRDTRTVAAGTGAYTRLVSALRWGLPLAVLLVLAAMFVWPMVGVQKLKSLETKAVPNLVVENLRLSGLNTKDEPYTLTAKRALQVPDAKGLMDLEQPQGELSLNGGAWLAGKAAYGRYDQNGKKLWLGGDVQLFHDQGYQFNTSEAQVDLNKKNAWGAQPVVIQGDFGKIQGEGFRMLEGGKVLVITGKSKAVLNGGTHKDKE